MKHMCWSVIDTLLFMSQKMDKKRDKYLNLKGNKIMNKLELIGEVASKSEISKKDVEKVINAFTNVVADTLVDGDKVAITGFGTFEVVERAARTGRNPKTGESIEIGASKSPKFKAGKALKDAVKG